MTSPSKTAIEPVHPLSIHASFDNMKPGEKRAPLLSLLLLLMMCGLAYAQEFVHPGCLSTQADLDRMKAKIAAGAEPWTSAYAVLVNNPHSSASIAQCCFQLPHGRR